jgi:UDP-N-acetylmuramoyl-tripeptide--D-alanyl-D-alanine ligase
MDEIYQQYLLSGKVTTDSRNCPPGSIYFALKGERFNGNDFALESLTKGCGMAVVDEVALKAKQGCVWVPDALVALQKLAAQHRKASGVQVVGITGSNGKTTTKELLAQVLSKKFKVWFTQGNLNNHIGVPLTLLSMPQGTELVVLEMGANHQGEIAELCKMAQPDCGLITNVGMAHIEGFGSFEGVKKGKGELYRHLIKRDLPVFVNWDNPHLREMLGEASVKAYKYGSGEANDVSGGNGQVTPYLRFSWRKRGVGESYVVQTQLTGMYNLENALAAIAVGVHFEVEDDAINDAISAYAPANHRSQIVDTGTNKVILDAYNANPSSMKVALDNFSAVEAARKVVILGGMKELGSESEEEHRALIKRVENIGADLAFLIGPEFKELLPQKPGYWWFESAQALISHLKTHPVRQVFILVKGSRANQLEKVMEAL